MGWGGAGLGSKEQGIDTPISGGDVSKIIIKKCLEVNFHLYLNCSRQIGRYFCVRNCIDLWLCVGHHYKLGPR